MAVHEPLPNTVGSLRQIAISQMRISQGRNTHYTVGKYLYDQLAAVTFQVRLHRRVTYPLVKTFNNEVLPHAPSPLSSAR